ncbi:MAG: CreA family protein [Gammaproteobacteria bacterium]|nr:CreA family protein [Gammaproteobacteria bacterium]
MIIVYVLFSKNENQVGNVSLGLLTLKDVKIERLIDPEISGVTCFIAHVKGDLDFVDPSNTSIACRQTGGITLQQINAIDKSDSGEVVFKASKSIFFKTLKIRRIFDKKSSTLIYLSYSTTEIKGSYEHSLSTVPLYGNPVWQQLQQQLSAQKEKS